MTPELTAALKQCPLFRDMTESDITRVTTAAGYRMQSFARRDIYCVSGDHCRHVDIVVSGELVARITGLSGRQVEVISLRCGDIIAPCFIYASDKRLPIDIEAQTDTTILRMQPSALQQMVDADACVRRNFIRCLSDIGSYLASKIGFLSLLTVREKVAGYLRSEAALQKSLHVRLDTSRQRLADSFAIQKFSLLRCLAEMEQQGIIKVDGKEITILAPERLR